MKVSIVNRWNGNVILEGEYADVKSLIEANPRADLTGANLARADLARADLARADLYGADLTGANLTGADLDFSVWPLWCGSLKVKVDDKVKAQLLYHVIAIMGTEFFNKKQITFANTFHRVGEIPKLSK